MLVQFYSYKNHGFPSFDVNEYFVNLDSTYSL